MTTGARLSFATGCVGAVLLAVNHFTAAAVNPSLGRADVVGTMLAVGLMLVGLNWTRIDPAARRPPLLMGKQGLQLLPGLPEAVRDELGWGSQMLLLNTPAVAVHCLWHRQVLLRRGLLNANTCHYGAMVQRVLATRRRVYLVDLKHYPARQEFSYLPEGTPAVVLEPVGSLGVLVVAGATPRCFNPGDLGWIQGWAQRLGAELEAALPAGSAPPDPTEAAPAAGPC